MIKVQKITYLHLPKNDDELCNRNMANVDARTWNIGSEGIKIVAAESWKMQKAESGTMVLSEEKKKKIHTAIIADAFMYSLHLLGNLMVQFQSCE